MKDLPTSEVEIASDCANIMYWNYSAPHFEIENWWFKNEGFKSNKNPMFDSQLNKFGDNLQNKLLIEKFKKLINTESKNDKKIYEAYKLLHKRFVKFYMKNNEDVYKNFLNNKADLYKSYKRKNIENRPDNTLNAKENSVGDLNRVLVKELEKICGSLPVAAQKFFNETTPGMIDFFEDEVFTEKVFESEHDKQAFILATNVKKDFEELGKDLILSNKELKNLSASSGLSIEYRNGTYFIGSENVKDVSFSILKKISANNDGQYYLNFRGTDLNIKDFSSYALNDYTNMENHYKKMEVVFSEILKKIDAKHNANNESKITKKYTINVSGHSLGATMVEFFMKNNSDSKIRNIKGYAFASAGLGLVAQKFINGITKVEESMNANSRLWEAHIAAIMLDNRLTQFIDRKLDAVIREKLTGNMGKAIFNSSVFTVLDKLDKSMNFMVELSPKSIKYVLVIAPALTGKPLANFYNLGKSLLPRCFNLEFDKNNRNDDRLVKVDNKTDLIPTLGNLFNKQSNKSIMISVGSGWLPFSIKSHDKSWYSLSLANELASRNDVNVFLKSKIISSLNLYLETILEKTNNIISNSVISDKVCKTDVKSKIGDILQKYRNVNLDNLRMSC